ncbi:MAG: hypothetical protein M3Z24_05940 [Chloroflexota bacterium]|nr:hypothetical protein [Chloroflexota bacterium]
MSSEDEAVQPPKRRRGRPPKQKKTLAFPSRQFIASNLSQESANRDEYLAYTIAEEQLSPFSSLLRHLLRHERAELSRVAHELNVSENTLYRWMNGNSEPRLVHLKHLLNALPEQRNNLTYVIQQTYPGLVDAFSNGVRDVQKEIYRRVMELVATSSDEEELRWQIPQAIFEYAMLHLDSARQGMAILFAKLMPAHTDGIHSLYEAIMRGNYPWPFTLDSLAYLGSTTLAGTAAIRQRVQTWDNLDEGERLQFEVDEFERSACAYPVMRANRLAGVLVISSPQPAFFADTIAQQAVVEYAQLLALAFRDDEFKPFSMMNLRPMPSLKWQHAEMQRSYVNRIISCARKRELSRKEAEVVVRREMEMEFEELARFQYNQHLVKEEIPHSEF